MSCFFWALSLKYDVATELVYTNVINKFLRSKLSLIFDKVTVPVGDFLTIFLFLVIVLIVLKLILSVLSPSKLLKNLAKTFFIVINTVSILLFLFIILYGLNYHVRPLGDVLIDKYNRKYSTNVKIDVAKDKKMEIYDFLSDKIKENRALIRDTNKSIEDQDISQSSESLAVGYNSISDGFANLEGKYSSPKKSFLSPLYKMIGQDGRYYILTNEVSINNSIPKVYRPFIIAKYMAYQRGVAREDEAIFFAYLAGSNSTSPDVKYSVYVSMMDILLKSTKFKDRVSYNKMYSKLDDETKRDIKEIENYKSDYGVAKGVRDLYYDSYKRINGDLRTNDINTQVMDILSTYYSLFSYQQ